MVFIWKEVWQKGKLLRNREYGFNSDIQKIIETEKLRSNKANIKVLCIYIILLLLVFDYSILLTL